MMSPSAPGPARQWGRYFVARAGRGRFTPAFLFGGAVPTRRILELIVVTVVAMKPIDGMARIWAHKTLGTTQPGSILHGVAEIVAVIA